MGFKLELFTMTFYNIMEVPRVGNWVSGSELGLDGELSKIMEKTIFKILMSSHERSERGSSTKS